MQGDVLQAVKGAGQAAVGKAAQGRAPQSGLPVQQKQQPLQFRGGERRAVQAADHVGPAAAALLGLLLQKGVGQAQSAKHLRPAPAAEGGRQHRVAQAEEK